MTNQQQRAVIYATGLHACLQRPLSSKVADDHAPEAVDGSPIADLAQCMLQVASEDDLGIIVEQTLHVCAQITLNTIQAHVSFQPGVTKTRICQYHARGFA